VTAPSEAPACAAPAVPAGPGYPAALPLRRICHFASDTVADHPEWLAAYHAPRSADEQWYIDDREAARAAAQDRAANAAIEPGGYLPEPTRTTGPMAAPPADEAETILPGTMDALDERTEEALDAFNDLHDSMPDETAALSVTEAPEPRRHGKRRRWHR